MFYKILDIKNYRFYILCLFIFFINPSIFSQQNELISCITEIPEDFYESENLNKETFQHYIKEYYNKLQSRTSSAITNVPVKIHIVTDSNGSTSITLDEILEEIEEANSFLVNSFLEITVCDDVNYIANNTLYDFDTDDQDLLYANNHSNIMNLYFVESISFGSVNACGYTYLPGNTSQYYDVIVMDNQCTNDPISTTLIHEFGHHFNLLHTHGSSNNELTDELVNGSNCSYAGDYVCDTPADPQLSSSNVSSVNCMYTGAEIDAQGQFFDPDTSNIMSYSPNTCTDFISDGQFARMYAGFHTYKTYYECPSFNIDFDININESCDDYMTVNYTDSSIGAVAWEWDIDGDNVIDYTIQNPSHVYTPGNYDVSLTIYDESNYSITKEFPSLIDFSSNIFQTNKIFLKLLIVNINENNWEFKNNDGEILYLGGPYDQVGEYNYELEIEDSQCYNFTIYDSAGDGLSGFNFNAGGYEFYELSTEDGTIIHTNTNFGYDETNLISTYSLGLNSNFDDSISIFPNPASNYIEIKYQNLIPDFYRILDVKGRIIKYKEIYNDNDLFTDVSSFNKGLYFISIHSGENVSNLKFLVK